MVGVEEEQERHGHTFSEGKEQRRLLQDWRNQLRMLAVFGWHEIGDSPLGRGVDLEGIEKRFSPGSRKYSILQLPGFHHRDQRPHKPS